MHINEQESEEYDLNMKDPYNALAQESMTEEQVIDKDKEAEISVVYGKKAMKNAQTKNRK